MPRTHRLGRVVASTTVTLVSLGGLTALAPPASAVAPSLGTVTAWGAPGWSQNTVPGSLAGRDVVAVSDGITNSLALTSDGLVTAWGTGNGRSTQIPPAGLDDITAVSAGYFTDLALDGDGKVTAWGTNYDGSTVVPLSLATKTVTEIAAGWYHEIALDSDGHVTAWGYNGSGQTSVPLSLSTKVVTAIAASQQSSMALTSDGEIVVWGYTGNGIGTVPSSPTGTHFVDVAVGNQSAMALTADGRVVAWGSGDTTTVPSSLDGRTVTAIDAGSVHDVALLSDGTVVSWGAGYYDSNSAPAGLTGVTQISAGYEHTLAIVGGSLATGTFGTAPTATVSGTPQVGVTLTASAGTVSPTPDSYTYRWFADGTEITGATASTFTPTADEEGAHLTAEVTAVKARYTSAVDVSDPTAVVAPGTLAVTGTDTVTGTARVTSTLTSTSTVATTPASTTTGQWLRDGSPIGGATGTTYVLGNDDAGATITHQVTASTDGYDAATVTSDGIGPVEGGVITLPHPTVTGEPVVDGTLTASVSGVDPVDAGLTYAWTRGSTVVATGSTYSPTAADAGTPLTVTATATKPHFDDATSSTPTGTVAAASFTTGPTATVSGTLKVGETLTAGTGDAAPAPSGFGYQWSADGSPIDGADQATYLLAPPQKHTAITVTVTALRSGYASSSSTSAPTGDVATNLAPSLGLSVADASIRRGSSTRLTWNSDEATGYLTASGGWYGAQATAGTATLRQNALGATTYVLRARNANGTTTAQVTLQVTRQAKALDVAAGDGLRLRGTELRVTTSGLDPAEPYTVRLAGTQVATGTASASGWVVRTVTIPTGTDEGRARVSVTGSESDRTGSDTVRVVRDKQLGLSTAKQRVRASDDQSVTVTGLASGEKVTVSYQGRRISPKGAHAGPLGGYTTTFDVAASWGTKTVRVTGQFAGRTAVRTFEVVRRCRVGHTCG